MPVRIALPSECSEQCVVKRMGTSVNGAAMHSIDLVPLNATVNVSQDLGICWRQVRSCPARSCRTLIWAPSFATWACQPETAFGCGGGVLIPAQVRYIQARCPDAPQHPEATFAALQQTMARMASAHLMVEHFDALAANEYTYRR